MRFPTITWKVEGALYLAIATVLSLQFSVVLLPQVGRVGSPFFDDGKAWSLSYSRRQEIGLKEVTPGGSKSHRMDSIARSPNLHAQGVGQNEQYFSACLVTMDDNYFWPGTKIS
jgi:hypothetical protein